MDKFEMKKTIISTIDIPSIPNFISGIPIEGFTDEELIQIAQE